MSLMDTLKTKAQQNVGANSTSLLQSQINTGMDHAQTAPDTPLPKAPVRGEPNKELAAKSIAVYEVIQNLPMITRPAKQALKPVDGFYYVEDEADKETVAYFAKIGMLAEVTSKKA
jgi:hypothetical protein